MAVEQTPTSAEASPAPAAGAVADPAPLGLAGFGITTLVLSIFNAHILNVAGTPVVFGLAIAYGGGAQLLAGMWEFKNNNTFGATAFTSYGAFWISFWFLTHFDAGGLGGAANPNNAGHAIGMYLLAWGIFTLYMWIASFGVSGAVNVVFLLLWITFFLLAVGDWHASETWTKVGGYVGLATAAAALYTSFAVVTNATFKKAVLPTFPFARPGVLA